jgi:hypothetical protein
LIWVGRVRVDTFSLDIKEVKLLIIILDGFNEGVTSSSARLGIKLLESLPLVISMQCYIINVVVEVRIVLYTLVESLEGVVKVWLFNDTLKD